MQASEALVAGAHSRLRPRPAGGGRVLLMLVAVLGGASLIRSAQDPDPGPRRRGKRAAGG